MSLSSAIVKIVRSFTGMFKVVNIYESKDISVENIRNIDLMTTSPGFKITPTDDPKMTVEIKGRATKNMSDGWEIQHQVNNQTVHVSTRRSMSRSFTLFSLLNLSCSVNIPRQYYDSIKVKTSSGSISIEDIAANAIYLTASSGSVEAKNNTSGTIYSIETSSGSIKASNNQAKEFDIRANSGSVRVTDLTADKTRIRTSSGSISAKELTGDVSAKASSGSIHFNDIELSGDWDIKTSSGSVAMHNVEAESIAVNFRGSSGSGSVNLKDMNFTEKSAHRVIAQRGNGEYKINVQTSSGSFSIS